MNCIYDASVNNGRLWVCKSGSCLLMTKQVKKGRDDEQTVFSMFLRFNGSEPFFGFCVF